MTAYDGPGGKAVLLHVTGTKPLKIDSVIVGKLVPDSGAFGRKLVVAIPANLQQPLGGVYAALTSFMTKVGGSSKGTPYVALKGCSGGELKFKGDFVFTDAPSSPRRRPPPARGSTRATADVPQRASGPARRAPRQRVVTASPSA